MSKPQTPQSLPKSSLKKKKEGGAKGDAPRPSTAPVITSHHGTHGANIRQQISGAVPQHQRPTTASYWRLQEQLWTKHHWDKEHYEYENTGVVRCSFPGPADYSPLATRPTGQVAGTVGKGVYNARAIGQDKESVLASYTTLGSPCFSKAYKKKKDAWWGVPGFQQANQQKRRKRAIPTNRIAPPHMPCNDPNCKSHAQAYPISLCSCVATLQPPDLTRCDLCKARVPADHVDAHKQKSCPRFVIKCRFCGDGFERSYLSEHELINCDKRQFECNWCNRLVARGDWANHRDRPDCPSKPVNCEWCFQRHTSSSYPQHQNVCEWKPHTCGFCKNLFPAKEIEEHKKICDKRPVSCRYCNQKLSFADARSHREQCPNRPAQCPQCHEMVEKSYWHRHQMGCFLITAAKLLVPKLQRELVGVAAEKLSPLQLPEFTTENQFKQLQVTAVQPFGVRLIDVKGQYANAGGQSGDFCYKIEIKKACDNYGTGCQGVKAGETVVVDTLKQNDFDKTIVEKLKPGDIIKFYINRPLNPRADTKYAGFAPGETIEQLMEGHTKTTVEFFCMGYWYHPDDHTLKTKYPYTRELMEQVIRLNNGQLLDSDIGDTHMPHPLWVEHGKAWEGREGPGNLKGRRKGRGFQRTKGKSGPRQLGMVNRAMTARSTGTRRSGR